MQTISCGLLAGILLAGCAAVETRAPDPVIQTRTVEVKVPVAVPCINAADIPALPKSTMRPGMQVQQLAAAAAVDLTAVEDVAITQNALLRACAKP